MKMDKITGGDMDEDGYYIHSISVSPAHRSKGIGAFMIEKLKETEKKVYLHVNINNERGQNFYKKVGFQSQSRDTIILKGKEVGTHLMALMVK